MSVAARQIFLYDAGCLIFVVKFVSMPTHSGNDSSSPYSDRDDQRKAKSHSKTDYLKLRRFKLHNLAFAIGLASAVLAEQSAFADTSANNKVQSTPDTNPDAPLNYGFYDREQLAQLPVEQRIKVPAACRGVWITPIPTNGSQPNVPVDQSDTKTRSDYAYYDPTEGSVLTGNVRISQPNRLLSADKVALNPEQTVATATGNVKIANPGFVTYGDSGVYNLDTQTGSIKDPKFIISDRQAHGEATDVIRENDHLTRIMDSVYSTCEPDTIGWKLKSRKLDLNQETGRGVARDAKLYIGQVPIFYTPYFNFPIDGRRSSGILIPTVRYTSNNGFDLAVPYYLNLAPNYDATVTPRIISNRGPMLGGEFRFLTENFGSGIINGAFLPNDSKYIDDAGRKDQDRKELTFQHSMVFNPHWSSFVNLNYVSDKDYFSDVGQSIIGPTSTLTMERSATLNYNNSDWGLSGYLRGLDYQRLDDKTVTDINRPYGRIQLHLDYDQGSLNGWQRFATNDTGYFQRDITDGSGPETNGLRQYNIAGIKYNFRDAGGYAIPSLSVRTLFYQDQTDYQANKPATGVSESPTAIVPQFTFDSGLIFERDAGSYLQTLEPRFFYAYSPYVQKQSAFPVFDTTYASNSYDQLFSPSRFIGMDRLDDNNFATLGITNRFYDSNGLERFRIGVADRLYFSDRKTRLAQTDAIGTSSSSGPGVEIGAAWNKNLTVDSSALWTPSGNLSTSSTAIHYATDTGRVTSLGYIFRRNVTEDNQIASRQATASFIQPVYNNFRVLGSVQYDLLQRVTRDALVGIDYDACCWSIALFGRSYYNDFDDPKVTDAHRSVVLQITFKGLASNSDSNLATLLKQKIYGFTQVDSTWQNR